MYQQNSGAGAKWFAWLALVILAIAFALGFNIKNATWLNGNIANATAGQLNLTTEIERQKADLDLQVLKNQTEIQIKQQNQQAEYEAASKKQELNAQAVTDMQTAQFRQNLFSTLNSGLLALAIAASVSIAAWGIIKSTASYKLAMVNAQHLEVSVQNSQPKMSTQPRRRCSEAAIQARRRELQARENELRKIHIKAAVKNTIPLYQNLIKRNLIPNNYPRAK